MTSSALMGKRRRNQTMKGFYDNGRDIAPCFMCKHKENMTVECPCFSCISFVDLALHKPNYETEFANFEREEATDASS